MCMVVLLLFFVKSAKIAHRCYLLNNYLYMLCYLPQILIIIYSNYFLHLFFYIFTVCILIFKYLHFHLLNIGIPNSHTCRKFAK